MLFLLLYKHRSRARAGFVSVSQANHKAMDWDLLFLILTMILMIGSSVAVYFRSSSGSQVKDDHPLMYVIAVQESVSGPPAYVPVEIQQLDQTIVSEKLFVYGQAVDHGDDGGGHETQTTMSRESREDSGKSGPTV